MRHLYLTILLALITCISSFSQSTDEGWKMLGNNDLKGARTFFENCVKANNKVDEANLALALIHESRGDDKIAFKHYSEFVKNNPNHYPVTYALWVTGNINADYGVKSKEQLAFLTQLQSDPKANGTMKSMASSMLGYHYKSANSLSKAKAEYAKIGSLEKWQLLGPFDNISASGFNKDFGALANPKPDAKFKSKVNAEVQWFEVKDIRNDKWIDFSYHFSTQNSIFYAQTFVNSPNDREVYLRSGTSGSIKIWVNDVLAYSEQEERDTDFDVNCQKVKLNAGNNRILVQIGVSEISSSNFMIRLTDADGNAFADITSNANYAEYKPGSFTPQPVKHFAEEYLENEVKKNPNSFLYNYLLANTYVRAEKFIEGRKTIKQIRETIPNSTIIGQLLINLLSRDNNKTERTKEQERIKLKDPECYYALILFFYEEYNKENYDAAEKILDKITKEYGVNESSDLKKLQIIAKRENQDLLQKAINEMYKKYPENYDFMATKYSLESSAKNFGAANTVLKSYFKKHYSDDVLEEIAKNNFKMGMTGEGLRLYKERVEDFPYAVGYMYDLIDLYMAMKDYSQAQQLQKKVIEKAPFHGYSWNKMGEIQEAMANNSEAIRSYKNSIYYDPTNYDARKNLRKLEGKATLFESMEKTDAYEIFKNAPSGDKYPGENSIILINDYQRIFYPEGAGEEKCEILAKTFNQAGVDNWKEYSIDYNSYIDRLIIEKAEVIKADGNKVKAETQGGYVVFSSLEAGDAIHIIYRKEDYSTGKLAHHFWDKFYMSYFIPSQTARYSLIVPKDKKFNYKVQNADIQPKITDIDDYKMYVWEVKDPKTLKDEICMPTLSEVGISLEITSFENWDYIANWYSDLSSTKSKADFEVKEAVAELFKEKKNLTETQKAKMIYEYIVKNIVYSNVSFLHSALVPQKASRTINSKMGDCKDVSTLFVAMSKEVGLKANLVLIDTRDNGAKNMVLPSINFNHCIARVETDNNVHFLELTGADVPFGAFPPSLIKANSLVIPNEVNPVKSEYQPLELSTRMKNTVIRISNISINGNQMIVSKSSKKTGDFAANMQADFKNLSKEEQMKSMNESVSSDFSTNVKLNTLDFKNLNTLDDTLFYSYNFTVDNATNQFAGINIFKMPWSESNNFSKFFTLDTRETDMNLWMFTDLENALERVEMNIPAGKVWVDLPAPTVLKSKHAEYKLEFKAVGTKLIATREFKMIDDVVKKEDYAGAKEFFLKISEYDSKQLGFK